MMADFVSFYPVLMNILVGLNWMNIFYKSYSSVASGRLSTMHFCTFSVMTISWAIPPAYNIRLVCPR